MAAPTPLLIPQTPGARAANTFDAIRLLMALLVVWSHSFALHQGTESHEPVTVLLNGVYTAGSLGVMVFFMISGFLITQSFLSSKTLRRFMEQRVRRIYPGYLVATSLCAFVVVPLFSSVRDLSPAQVATTLVANLFLRNHFPPADAFAGNPVPLAVNGSLWSIPFEFWCYIGVAALGVSGLLTRRWVTTGLLVVALIGRVVLDVADRKPGGGLIGVIIGWPYQWFVILPSFLLGMVAHLYQTVLPRRPWLLAGLLAAAIGSAHLNIHAAHLLIAPALAYATFYVAFSPAVRLQRAGAYGDFSYGTYLYAYPIQQMLFALVGPRLSLPIFILLSLILSLAAGICSWFMIERWFIRRRSHLAALPAIQPAR